jgi:hypothetical protein
MEERQSQEAAGGGEATDSFFSASPEKSYV